MGPWDMSLAPQRFSLTCGAPLEIRLDLIFLSSLVAQETGRFAVSIESRYPIGSEWRRMSL
jgi:hypothetical protein